MALDSGGDVILPEATIFRPTAQEWADPLAYIANIVRPQVETQAGIAKIVPPDGWRPPCGIDKDTFKFRSKAQTVHQLQSHDSEVAISHWWEDYNNYLISIGSRHRKNPTYLAQEIDLYRLYRLVSRKGGYHPVTDDKGWRDIAQVLDINDKSGNAAYTVRHLYQKLLLPYEDHCRAISERSSKFLAVRNPGESKASKDPTEMDADAIDDAEAAEILEAMLGLAPAVETAEPARKKRKNTPQDAYARNTVGHITAVTCDHCSLGHAPHKILVCDDCDKAWHTFCLNPPLEAVPEGEWFCPLCLSTDAGSIDELPLSEFESIDANFRNQWYGGEEAAAKVTDESKEADFWKAMESGQDAAEVLHGANLDTTKVGSGFPRLTKLGADSEYASHPWNLNNIPKLEGEHASLLHWVHGRVPGATAPRLYFGMLFSSSCWHVHAHQWYSLSYNHFGAAKRWYAIPGYAAGVFEATYKETAPEQVASTDALMFDPAFMMSPHALTTKHVPVTTVTQEAGSFILTFPNAYHANVDLGMNCTEAVNFAPADWLRFGAMSNSRLRHFRQPSVISHERLVLRVAASPEISARTSYWVHKELGRVIEEETLMRTKLWAEGVLSSRQVVSQGGFGPSPVGKRDAECSYCHMKLHLSGIECDCSPGKYTCLHHAANLCDCPVHQKRMVWRYTIQNLEAIYNALGSQLNADVAMKVENEEAVLAEVQSAAVSSLAAVLEATKKEDSEKAGEGGSELDLLAGFARELGEKVAIEGTTTRKRKREEANPTHKMTTGELPLCFVSANGYVQGPVRPFAPVDVYTEDQSAMRDWLQSLNERCRHWLTRATAVLDQGASMAAELPELVLEAEQYTWGGAGATESAQVAEIVPRLRAANDYMSALASALKGKPTLEALDELFAQDPPPLKDPPGLNRLREAAQAGREWLARAKESIPETGMVDYRTLEAVVSDAYKLGVSLLEAKALKDRFNEARRVAESIRAALPTAREVGRRKKDGTFSVDLLWRLQAEAAATQVETPEFANLNFSLEKMEVWQSRVKALTGMRAPLEELKELVEESEGLYLMAPELHSVRQLIDKGETWLKNMRNLVNARAPLKKMRDLLHAGLRLPVELPEVEELRRDIRRREWEESAKKAVNNKNTIHSLVEALSTANDMGAGDTSLAESLRAKVLAAEAWDERAGEFMARVQREGLKDTDRPSMEEFHLLVVDGISNGVKLDRLTHLHQALLHARKWAEKARECLTVEAEIKDETGAMDIEFIDQRREMSAKPTARGEALHSEAGSGEAKAGSLEAKNALDDTEDNGANIMDVDALATAALKSEKEEQEKAVQKRQGGRRTKQGKSGRKAPSKPHLEAVTQLLTEYEKMYVHMPEAAGLRNLRDAADVWLVDAQPILDQSFVTIDQLPILNDLIAKGKQLGMSMEQLDILEANVEALLWGEQAKQLLAKLPTMDALEPQYSELESEYNRIKRELAEELQQQQQQQQAQPNQQQGRKRAAAEPSVPQQKMHRRTAVVTDAEREENKRGPQDKSTTTDAAKGAEEKVQEKDQAPPSPPSVPIPYAERPELVKMMLLLEEGSILPCDEDAYTTLQKHVELGKRFDVDALQFLATNKDGLPTTLTPVKGLKALIARGDMLMQQIPSLMKLVEISKAHETWEAKIKELMSAAGPRPPYSELLAFQKSVSQSPITSELREHIDIAVGSIEDWVERCRRAMAKRNTNMPLDRCLDIAAYSVDCAVEQFERRLEVEKKLVAANGNPTQLRPDLKAHDEEEGELYCLCQQPYNVDTAMISCDSCKEWYHLRCVGISQTQARSLRRYSCPICSAVRGNLDSLDLSLNKLRRTKRPDRAELGNLLAELKELPVYVDVEYQLDRILTRYDRWTTATQRAIEVHEASKVVDTADQLVALSDGMLHQLCKSALAMEIDGIEAAEKILRLLRCNRWRAKAEAALRPAEGGKTPVDALEKLIQEGERNGIDPGVDVVGRTLVEALNATKAWQERAKQVVEEIKVSGGNLQAFEAAVAKAKALIQEAETLAFSVDRELESLQESSKLYCICKKPYDEQIPMVGCDFCNEWYHYECVGLKPPGSGGNEEDTELEEKFKCPVCCIKAGTKYPQVQRLPQASTNTLTEMGKGISATAAVPPKPLQHQPQQPQMTQQHQQAFAAAMAMQGMPPGFFPGMQSGMVMPVPAAMMAPPEAMQNMMQMFPGGVPMFGFGMNAQAMAAAAAAAAAAQQQQQKPKQAGKKHGGKKGK